MDGSAEIGPNLSLIQNNIHRLLREISNSNHMRSQCLNFPWRHKTYDFGSLFFTEQLYRAMTILRNEKYHNE